MRVKMTVCIPVFNGEKFLYDTLQSISEQSYQDFELFLIDNASTDSSIAIASKFLKIIPKFQIVKNDKNIGAEANFNKCLSLGEGEMIAIFHADDIYHKDILKESVRIFSNKSVGVVGSLGHIIDSSGKKTGRRYTLPVDQNIQGERLFRFFEIFKYVSKNGNDFMVCPTMVFRRSVICELGGFEFEKYKSSSDLAMWLKISQKYFVAILNKDLISYRVHTSQATQHLIRENTSIPDSVKVMRFYKEGGVDIKLYHEFLAFNLLLWLMRRIRADKVYLNKKIHRLVLNEFRKSFSFSLQYIKYTVLLFLVSIDVLLSSSRVTNMIYRNK